MLSSGKAKPNPVGDEDDESLDAHAAARVLGLSVSYVNKMRITGEGPQFMQIGKHVLYRLSDLRAWQVSRLRKSTSDPGSPKAP